MNDMIKQTLMKQMQEAAMKMSQQKDGASHFDSSGTFSSVTQGGTMQGNWVVNFPKLMELSI